MGGWSASAQSNPDSALLPPLGTIWEDSQLRANQLSKLLPCFSDFNQEAHVPGLPSWVQANEFVGRSEKGSQGREFVQRTLTRPPGSLRHWIVYQIPLGMWEVVREGTLGEGNLWKGERFAEDELLSVTRSVMEAVGKEGYNLCILPVNQVMKVAISLSHAIQRFDT